MVAKRKSTVAPKSKTSKSDRMKSSPTLAPKEDAGFDYPKALEQYGSKSAVIRSLAAEGKDVKTIYHTLVDAGVTNEEGTNPIRYQHVRNVLKMPIGKATTSED